jgi:hypothetical protein
LSDSLTPDCDTGRIVPSSPVDASRPWSGFVGIDLEVHSDSELVDPELALVTRIVIAKEGIPYFNELTESIT